ncbi:MAG: bifunctional hydroxymethylpyrimidine kinase/phosphomethylpyrimidine kinase [Pseudomonadota bacterium]
MNGRVLIIAGSDPSGGAGIQADIKTVTALGGYASTAITALTVQNTMGVSFVQSVEAEVVAAQIGAVLDDIGADAIKIGMIGSVDIVDVIAEKIASQSRQIPVVLDPVLVATSGDALAGDGTAAAILDRLLPIAAVVTPNRDEAAALTGIKISDRDAMVAAGEALRSAGAEAALVKGGHMDGDMVYDVLVRDEGATWFQNQRLKTNSTHGTGCTLASATATGLAQGMAVSDAVARAIAYVHEAIASAPGFGKGHGPLNHAHTLTMKR